MSTPKQQPRLVNIDDLAKLFDDTTKGEWYAENVVLCPERTAYAKLCVGRDAGNRDEQICDTMNSDAVEIAHGDEFGAAHYDVQGMKNLKWMAEIHNEFPVIRDELRLLWKYQDHMQHCVEKLQRSIDEVLPRSIKCGGKDVEVPLALRVMELICEVLVARRAAEKYDRDLLQLRCRNKVLHLGYQESERVLNESSRELAACRDELHGAKMAKENAEAEVAVLKSLVESLKNRVGEQAEILARSAERDANPGA